MIKRIECIPSVVPYFLRNQERGQQYRAPVAGVQRHASKGNEAIHENERDNVTLGTELRTIRDGLDELVDVLERWYLLWKRNV